jgi:hypothetical protein
MKKVLTGILLLLALNVQADWRRGLGIAAYHVGTVALGAVGDAVFDEGNKDLGHFLKAAEVGALIGGTFIFKIHRSEALSYVLSYGFIRFSMFDSFYNLQRDLPLLYNGSTSVYDRTMNKMPDHGKAWYKSFSLVVGFAIPIKEL